MASPQADYVLQHTKKIVQVLQKAGGGKLDRKIASLCEKMETIHARLGDKNQGREWARLQQELLAAGQQLFQEARTQADEIERAANKISKYPGTSRQVDEVKRLLFKIPGMRADLNHSLSALKDSKLPTAGFNSQELDPANITGQVFTHYHNGTDCVTPATFRLTGPDGSSATISMEHVHDRLYGGHDHIIAPEHLGTIDSINSDNFQYNATSGKATFKVPRGSSAELRYKPSDVCARRKFTLNLHWGSAGLGWMIYVDVRYAQKLYDLFQYDLPYLKLYQGDPNHRNQDSHYCTKEMIAALEKPNHAYGQALESGEFDVATHPNERNPLEISFRRPEQLLLWINDMSLPWGGTFKTEGKMQEDAHETHKWGNDVDINWTRMNSAQRSWMWANAPSFFHKVDTHAKGKPNEHWHLDVD